MKVLEVFDSIQGEGPYVGCWATFVRFKGCNLGCEWCDTKTSWDNTYTGVDYTVDELVERLKKTEHWQKIPVVLTGGEPGIQDDIDKLIDVLHEHFIHVHVETNGVNMGKLKNADVIVCSPKPQANYYWDSCVPPKYIKLVVSEELTDEHLLDVIKRFEQSLGEPLIFYEDRIILQPCDGDYYEESKHRIIEMIQQYPMYVRAGCQLHKVLGVM